MKKISLIIFICIIFSIITFNSNAQSKNGISIKNYKVTNIALDSILTMASEDVLSSKLIKKKFLYGCIQLIYVEDELYIYLDYFNDKCYNLPMKSSNILGYFVYKGIPIFLYSKMDKFDQNILNPLFLSNNYYKKFKIIQEKIPEVEGRIGFVWMTCKGETIEIVSYVIIMHYN